jgi:hypothetical protein
MKPEDGSIVSQMEFVGEHRLVAAINCRGEDAPIRKSWSKLLLMDLYTQHVLSESRKRARAVGSMAISEDGGLVAVGDSDCAEVYGTSDMAIRGRTEVRDVAYDLPCLSISSDGRYLACASACLAVRELRTGTTVFREKADEDLVRSKACLIACPRNKAAQSSAIENDMFLRANLCFQYIRFVDSGKKLMAVTRSGTLRVWRTADWKSLISETLTQSQLLEEIRRRSGKRTF